MSEVTQINQRKADHIRINLDENVNFQISAGFEKFRFMHRALPETNLDEIDLKQSLFKRQLNIPLLISSMTGGTEQAAKINQILAEAAEDAGVAMGVGSQRAALEKPERADSFKVRQYAPNILLFANLGGVQLNYGFSVNDCQHAVEMIEADALILHFNALQEAVQPEGDTRFAGLLKKIEEVCRVLTVPVIAKEVGWGFSEIDVKNLVNCGIQAIDVAGAGGTSWSQVEKFRATTKFQADLAAAFLDWGIPTTEAIQIAHSSAPNIPIFASGGLRTGIDIAKSIALGACVGGMAGPFLKAAAQSPEKIREKINLIAQELKVAMFVTGAANLIGLRHTPIYKTE